jgi:hypothetical protein
MVEKIIVIKGVANKVIFKRLNKPFNSSLSNINTPNEMSNKKTV